MFSYPKQKVFFYIEMGEKGIVLKYKTNLSVLGFYVCLFIKHNLVVNSQRAAVGFFKACEYVKQCRFSASAFSQDRNDLTL